MTTAKKVSEKLRSFMAENHFDHSDIYRGMIAIINPDKSKGKTRGEGRKPVLMALRKPTPQTSMDIGEESCLT